MDPGQREQMARIPKGYEGTKYILVPVYPLMYLPEVRVYGYLGARGTLGRSLEAVDAWEMKTRKEVVARRAATTSGLQPGTSPGVSLLRTETRQPICSARAKQSSGVLGAGAC